MQTLGDYRTALLNLAPASAKQASPILESLIRAYRHCGRGGGPIHCARQATRPPAPIIEGTCSAARRYAARILPLCVFVGAQRPNGQRVEYFVRVCSTHHVLETRTPGQSHQGHDASLAVSRETVLKQWQLLTVAVPRLCLAISIPPPIRNGPYRQCRLASALTLLRLALALHFAKPNTRGRRRYVGSRTEQIAFRYALRP